MSNAVHSELNIREQDVDSLESDANQKSMFYDLGSFDSSHFNSHIQGQKQCKFSLAKWWFWGHFSFLDEEGRYPPYSLSKTAKILNWDLYVWFDQKG